MDSTKKTLNPWIPGCAAGCVSGCGCFLVVSTLLLASAWLLWEQGGVHEWWVKADVAGIWSSAIGAVVGLLVGVGVTLLGKGWFERRSRR